MLFSANVCSGGKILIDEEHDVVIGEVVSWICEISHFSFPLEGKI